MKTLYSYSQIKDAYKVGFRYVKNVGLRYVVARRRHELHNGAVKIKECMDFCNPPESTMPLRAIAN
jgi:hypothetical protein